MKNNYIKEIYLRQIYVTMHLDTFPIHLNKLSIKIADRYKHTIYNSQQYFIYKNGIYIKYMNSNNCYLLRLRIKPIGVINE